MPADQVNTESDSPGRDFFTVGTFASLAGATAAVVIISNTVSVVFGEPPMWMPLSLAMLCSLGAYVYSAPSRPALPVPRRLLRYSLIVLNGCLIYTSAFGAQTIVESTEVASTPDNGDAEATPVLTTTTWRSVWPWRETRELDRRPITHR